MQWYWGLVQWDTGSTGFFLGRKNMNVGAMVIQGSQDYLTWETTLLGWCVVANRESLRMLRKRWPHRDSVQVCIFFSLVQCLLDPWLKANIYCRKTNKHKSKWFRDSFWWYRQEKEGVLERQLVWCCESQACGKSRLDNGGEKKKEWNVHKAKLYKTNRLTT